MSNNSVCFLASTKHGNRQDESLSSWAIRYLLHPVGIVPSQCHLRTATQGAPAFQQFWVEWSMIAHTLCGTSKEQNSSKDLKENTGTTLLWTNPMAKNGLELHFPIPQGVEIQLLPSTLPRNASQGEHSRRILVTTQNLAGTTSVFCHCGCIQLLFPIQRPPRRHAIFGNQVLSNWSAPCYCLLPMEQGTDWPCS